MVLVICSECNIQEKACGILVLAEEASGEGFLYEGRFLK